MGINIQVVKLIGKTYEETWNNDKVPYYLTEKQDWFDSLRYFGDSDFVLENDFIYLDYEMPTSEQELARPKDFKKCREWVIEKVYEGNQQRFLNALDKIESDSTLCFSWSW